MNGQQCRCHPQLLSQLGCQCRYAPAAWMTPAEAIEHATSHIIEAQSRLIARLTAENAELRRELGK